MGRRWIVVSRTDYWAAELLRRQVEEQAPDAVLLTSEALGEYFDRRTLTARVRAEIDAALFDTGLELQPSLAAAPVGELGEHRLTLAEWPTPLPSLSDEGSVVHGWRPWRRPPR